MLFDKVIAFDNLRQVIVLIADMQLAEGETGYNKAALELKHMAELLHEGKKIREPSGRLKGPVTPLFDRLADAARERVAANKAKRPLADVRRAAERRLFGFEKEIGQRFCAEFASARRSNARAGRRRLAGEALLQVLFAVYAGAAALLFLRPLLAEAITFGAFTSAFYAAVGLQTACRDASAAALSSDECMKRS